MSCMQMGGREMCLALSQLTWLRADSSALTESWTTTSLSCAGQGEDEISPLIP